MPCIRASWWLAVFAAAFPFVVQDPKPTPTPAPTATPPAAPAAAAADVASADAVVTALYATISGPAGQARDWARLRSLFHRDGRLGAVVRGPRGMRTMLLTVDDYVVRSGPVLEKDGFYEQELRREVQQFGDLAHVFSTYEGRHALADEQPFLRGINSIQLVREGGRWHLLQILWEQESDAGPIPPQYLPAPK